MINVISIINYHILGKIKRGGSNLKKGRIVERGPLLNLQVKIFKA